MRKLLLSATSKVIIGGERRRYLLRTPTPADRRQRWKSMPIPSAPCAVRSTRLLESVELPTGESSVATALRNLEPRMTTEELMKSISSTSCLAASASVMALLVAGCQTTPPPPPTSPEVVGQFAPGYLRGYLNPKTLPNSLALLPKPPADGSAELEADLAAYKAARTLRGTKRWDLAVRDADLKFPQAASAFACTMDIPISQEQTPHLNMLLRRTLVDAGLSTYAAKDTYQRKRPFVAMGDTTCTPGEEAALAKDGSYPSGHSAVGWAWALVLVEVDPERTNALLERGYAYGQSRVVCGAHWQSDVTAGRVMGAASVARLHSDETFLAQLAAAKAEVQAARAKGLKAPGECKAE